MILNQSYSFSFFFLIMFSIVFAIVSGCEILSRLAIIAFVFCVSGTHGAKDSAIVVGARSAYTAWQRLESASQTGSELVSQRAPKIQ